MRQGTSASGQHDRGPHARPALPDQRAPRRLRALLTLILVGVVSGCAGMNNLWNRPISTAMFAGSSPLRCDTDQEFGAAQAPGKSDGLSDRLLKLWNTPVYTLSDPDAGYATTACDGGFEACDEIGGDQMGCDQTGCSGGRDHSSLGSRIVYKTHELWNTPAAAVPQTLADSLRDVWHQPFFWRTQPPPEYVDPTPYRNWASEIDYPDVVCPPPTELFVAEPRRLRNPEKDDVWDMSLEQAIRIALSNSEVIRSSGQFLNPNNSLLANSNFIASSLDPAIQETGVLYGQRGVEAALSEFDTQFTTTMTWGRDEQIQNSSIGTGVPPGSTLVQETGVFSAGLTKRLATGGVIAVTQDWNYQGSNVNQFLPNQRLFPSAYSGRLRVEARQPLWAGAGTEYTRIAGPITEQIQGVTGVQQGVVIARINNDIQLAEFEGAIRDLLRDVESLYWQLYLAYQKFDGEMRLMSDAVDSYRNVQTLLDSASPLAGTLEEADAVEFVYQAQARVDDARDKLYDVEAQLRRILGLAVNDGKIIRPLDEPTVAEYVPDWQVTFSEALSRRVELRKQKWNIKQIELQVRAAEHLVKPRLDVVGAYQVNGFGNDLLGSQQDGVTQRGLGSAYGTLTQGNQTGWNLGVEFSVPLGLRFAHTQVKNLEFKLAKARAVLAEAENEVGHELADTFRELDRTYLQMRNNLNRKQTAARRLTAIEALHLREPERYSEDAILRSREQLNQIEQAYIQSVVEYNVALMELHYRSGKLLELDNVHLSEGPWDAAAECEVVERMDDRRHSIPTATMMHQEPEALVYPGGSAPPIPPAEVYGPAAKGWIDEAPVEEVMPMVPPRAIEAPQHEVIPPVPPALLGPLVDQPAGRANLSSEP